MCNSIILNQVKAEDGISKWRGRLKYKATFLAGWKNISRYDATIMCNSNNNSCKPFLDSDWNNGCKLICKFSEHGGIHEGSFDYKDTKTGNKCCGTNVNGGKPR